MGEGKDCPSGPMTIAQDIAQIDHVSEYGRWTLFRRRPSRLLAPYVREIQGYFEEGGDAIIRKEVPSGIVPLIVIFGTGFTLHGPGGGDIRPLNRSFIAGLHQKHVLVGSKGRALCMQINFTPLGARRFLQIDMCDLANRVLDLRDVVGAFADRLEERLAETMSWEKRFAIVETGLLQRMAESRADPLVGAAWKALESETEMIRIERLARDLDCSRKHLAALFRRDIGLSPKAVARIFRFERAMRDLVASRYMTLADLAAASGYADQAHFNRDFADFAGESPRALRARILPDGTGIMADGW